MRIPAEKCTNFVDMCVYGWKSPSEIDDFIAEWHEWRFEDGPLETAIFGDVPAVDELHRRLMDDGNAVINHVVRLRMGEASQRGVPEWANAYIGGEWVPGAQLCTRDGRVFGNAVISAVYNHKGNQIAIVITDTGASFTAAVGELAERWHPPVWRMDASKSPGARAIACADRRKQPAEPTGKSFSQRDIAALGPSFVRAVSLMYGAASLFRATDFTFLAEYEFAPGVVSGGWPDLTDRATIRDLICVVAKSQRFRNRTVRETINAHGTSIIEVGGELVVSPPDTAPHFVCAGLVEALCGARIVGVGNEG